MLNDRVDSIRKWKYLLLSVSADQSSTASVMCRSQHERRALPLAEPLKRLRAPPGGCYGAPKHTGGVMGLGLPFCNPFGPFEVCIDAGPGQGASFRLRPSDYLQPISETSLPASEPTITAEAFAACSC